jgi:hypothetical protein
MANLETLAKFRHNRRIAVGITEGSLLRKSINLNESKVPPSSMVLSAVLAGSKFSKVTYQKSGFQGKRASIGADATA